MIFYFSATGNTRWAAKQLHEATGDELFFISDQLSTPCRYKLQPGERIGFCFPVHGWRPPRVVREFIARLRFDSPTEGHFTFSVITAGDTTGETFPIFERDLKDCGLALQARCALLMPESYVGLPFMDVDKVEREKEKKVKAANDLEEFIKAIVARRKGLSEIVKGPMPGFFSGPVGAFFVRYLITDRPFHVDRKRCISYGKCEKVCPVGDVRMVADGSREFPTWIHNGECLTCFACYHHCPKKAIDYGHRTQHKGQYYFKKI